MQRIGAPTKPIDDSPFRDKTYKRNLTLTGLVEWLPPGNGRKFLPYKDGKYAHTIGLQKLRHPKVKFVISYLSEEKLHRPV